MKNDMRLLGVIFAALVVLTTTGTLGQASALSVWQIGATTGTLPTGTVDEISYFSVPNLPSSALSTLTLFWIGAYTTSGGTTYLTQPELRAESTTQWRVYFEVVHGTVQDDIFPTNMYCPPNSSVLMYNAILSSGKSFQDIEDHNGAASCNAVGVSAYLNKYNYGTTFTQGLTTLESYDTTSSDFHSMNGNSQFTNFRTSTDYSTYSTSSLTADHSTGTLPPSCISSTGGSGTNTITINC
jgi:hypothetical protein